VVWPAGCTPHDPGEMHITNMSLSCNHLVQHMPVIRAWMHPCAFVLVVSSRWAQNCSSSVPLEFSFPTELKLNILKDCNATNSISKGLLIRVFILRFLLGAIRYFLTKHLHFWIVYRLWSIPTYNETTISLIIMDYETCRVFSPQTQAHAYRSDELIINGKIADKLPSAVHLA